jgi:hypothetical protein
MAPPDALTTAASMASSFLSLLALNVTVCSFLCGAV